MLFLLKYWQPILSAILTAALALGAHRIDMMFVNADHAQALAEQSDTLIKQCNADKAITTEVSHDYQTQIADLNARLSQLDSMCGTTRVTVPAAKPATGRYGPAGNCQPAGTHGVANSALYSLAGEGEKYRLQLIACQSFVTKTWAEHAR